MTFIKNQQKSSEWFRPYESGLLNKPKGYGLHYVDQAGYLAAIVPDDGGQIVVVFNQTGRSQTISVKRYSGKLRLIRDSESFIVGGSCNAD